MAVLRHTIFTMDESGSESGYSLQSNVSLNMSLMATERLDFTAREWALVICLGLMILSVILGNILTLTAIAKHRPLQTPPVYLIASLAIADLMVGLMVMPLSLMYEVTVQWLFKDALCDFWISLDVLCCTASILNLCVIALDRYWAVTKPLEYKAKRTPLRMLCMIAVVWIISLVISTTPLFGWRNDRPAPLTCMISQSPSYTIFSTFGAFFIPMSIMLVVYARIFLEARKRIHGAPSLIQSCPGSSSDMSIKCSASDITQRMSSFFNRMSSSDPMIDNLSGPCARPKTPVKAMGKQRRRSSPGIFSHKSSPFSSPTKTLAGMPPHNRASSMSVKPPLHQSGQFLKVPSSAFIQQRILQRRHLASVREQKAVKTLAVLTGTFLVCWLPFFVTALLVPFCQHCDLPVFWRSFVLWLGYFNSVINPIIYTKFNKDFKVAYGKLLCCPSRRSPGKQTSKRGLNGERKRPNMPKANQLEELKRNRKSLATDEKDESRV